MERIGIAACTVIQPTRLCSLVAQIIQCRAQCTLWDRNARRFCLQQCIGHIGVQPQVIATRAPKSETAVPSLARQNAVNARLQGIAKRLLGHQPHVCDCLPCQQQGLQARCDLFGAAIRIGAQMLDQARHIQCSARARNQCRAPRPRAQPVKCIGVERKALTGG